MSWVERDGIGKIEINSPAGQVKMCETMPAAVSRHQKYFLQSLALG